MGRRARDLTDEDRAEVVRLYIGEKVGLADIAKVFTDKGKKISPTTVARIIRLGGGAVRKRGTRSSMVKTKVEEVSTFNV